LRRFFQELTGNQGEIMKPKLAVLAVLVFAVMALMAPALANHTYQEHPPKQPEVVEKAPEAPKAPGGPDVAGANGAKEVLPVTGSDLTLFVAAGALIVGVGAAMVRRSRARVTRA
jgi:LPXTG-motif cell wall-anchored protein